MSLDPAPASTPIRTPWILVGLLVIAGIAAAQMFSKVASVFGDVQARFAMDDVTAGLAMSLPALTAVALGVSASVIVSHVGERKILLIALIGGGALSLLQAIEMPAWLFLASRVIEGAAHLGIVVSAPVIVLKATAPAQRGFVMTVWSLFFGIGFTISGIVAPPLVRDFGVGAVFIAHAALMLTIAAVLAFVKMPPDQRITSPLNGGRFLREHVAAYRDLRAVLPSLVFIAHTFMYTPIITFVPTFVSGDTAAFLLVALPLASIVGTLLSGVVIRFIASAGAVVTTAYVLVAGGMIAVAVVLVNIPLATVAALVLMVFSGLIQGATFALIPALSHDPVTNARANGVLTQVGNIGSLAGPPVFAAIIATSASIWPFAITVLVACAFGVVASVVAWRTSRKPAPASDHGGEIS